MVGIALKPGVSQQLVHSLQERVSAAASRLEKHLPSAEIETEEAADNVLTESQPENIAGESAFRNKIAAPIKSTGYVPNDPSSAVKAKATTEISFRETGEGQDLRQENEILRTLLRHQELIANLKNQNVSILRVLSEQLDLQIVGEEVGSDRHLEVTPSLRVARKNEAFHYFHTYFNNAHRKCFDCRISARRRR